MTRVYGPIAHKDHIRKIIDIVANSKYEYGVIFDGTPSFAEAECVMLRLLTNNLNIVDLVVRIGLFDEKMNNETLSNHLIETIQGRLNLDVKNWITSMSDCASTNIATLKNLTDKMPHLSPFKAYCINHGFSNTSKQLHGTAIYGEKFQNIWPKTIQFPGKARKYTRSIFREEIRTSGGVRFFFCKNRADCTDIKEKNKE